MSAIAWLAQPPEIRPEWRPKRAPKVAPKVAPKATRAERVANLVQMVGLVTVEMVMHHMMIEDRREARRVMYDSVNCGGCRVVKANVNASPVLKRL